MLKNSLNYPPPIFYKVINNKKEISYHRKQNKIIIKKNDLAEQSNFKLIYKISEIDLTEFELNNSSYINALLYDKRMFCQYFYSLLKFEHSLYRSG